MFLSPSNQIILAGGVVGNGDTSFRLFSKPSFNLRSVKKLNVNRSVK